MKLKILNISSDKSEMMEISDKLLKLKVNHKLIKQVIDWQLNHAKPRTAKTKQRNEIKGSTKKDSCAKGKWELDTQVEKHLYLLVEVLHMDRKVTIIKLKK